MLKRPIKSAWAFYFIWVLITGLIVGLVWGFSLLSYTNKAFVFFKDNIKEAVFENGEIKNMPILPKQLHFEEWTILIDSSFTTESLADQTIAGNDSAKINLPALCIGPRQAYLFTAEGQRTIDYPASFTKIIDIDYIKDGISSLKFILFAVSIVAAFLYKAVAGMLYVLLVITPIVIFKFRRMGIGFGDGFKAALYLASIQLVVSTVLLVLKISLPWSFLIFILFYIFYIGAFVNIDFTYGRRQADMPEKSS